MNSTRQTLRIFISSTFRDMHAEREELIKRVFPRLRKLCERRGVSWGEVDLRWGITAEQAERGEVLPICLAEIDRCRPHFLGLLGERYGWVPESLPEDLLEQQPWLAEHPDRSVTDLEVLHGVLRHSETKHAFFYFRNPGYLDSLAPQERPLFQECASPADVERWGLETAERRAEGRRHKLEDLKERIRASGVPVRENYADPQTLGQLVLNDLTALIDRLFPEGSQPDPLDQEAAEHDAFADSRLGIYVPRQADLDRLEAHVQGDGPPLIVLGASGSGKSALVANWARQARATRPDVPFLTHFIGATPRSSDWSAMLRRLLGELNRLFQLNQEVPDDLEDLRAAFARFLHLSAARGRVVLVLDALDQLEDRDGAPDLFWLPPEIPPGVRLILSTLPGRPLEHLRQRGWPLLTVEPLRSDERRILVTAYLGQYGKTLATVQGERIVAAEQSANPLYLRTVLEELRVFGTHEQLDRCLDHYLEAPGIPELYSRVLQRYEKDYENERPGLVRDAFSLIWSANRGLQEHELLDLLGNDNGPLPQAYWSVLCLAADHNLVSRAGRISFFHDYLRQAVRERYLPDVRQQRAMHRRLADYFSAQEIGPRQVEELPGQLARLQAWDELADLLAPGPFFDAAWDADENEVKFLWAQIEAESPRRRVEACRSALLNPAAHVDRGSDLARFLFETGYQREALQLLDWLAERARQDGYQKRLAWLLVAMGNCNIDLGRIDQALSVYQEAEQIARRTGYSKAQSWALGNRAVILKDRGDAATALTLFRQVEQTAREEQDRDSLATSLGHQASILADQGKLEQSLKLRRQQEEVAREGGDLGNLRACCGGLALLHEKLGEDQAALAFHDREEAICRQLGDAKYLSTCLLNRAQLLSRLGRTEQARALHQELEALYEERQDPSALATVLGEQARLQKNEGNRDAALALYRRAESLYRQAGNRDKLAVCLGHLGDLYRRQPNEAMTCFREQEQLCLELGDRDTLIDCLNSQGRLCRHQLEHGQAMHYFQRAETLAREIGEVNGLLTSLGNQARLLEATGEWDRALELQRQREQVSREAHKRSSLASALGGQANILGRRGEWEAALTLYREEEQLYRDLGEEGLRAASLGNQAIVFKEQGNLEQALALHDQEETIYRRLRDRKGEAASLGNRAVIHFHQGNLDAAFALFSREEQLCREEEDLSWLAHAIGGKGAILRQRGDYDGALALLGEKEELCRRLRDKEGLADCLSSQAAVHYFRSEYARALDLERQSEQLYAEMGDPQGIHESLGLQAILLSKLGDVDGALLLLRRAERIGEEHGQLGWVLSALRRQANTCADAGRHQELLEVQQRIGRLSETSRR